MTGKDVTAPIELADVRRLAQNADSDHVTVEKLTGEEMYFPEALGVISLIEEAPQHIILLTKRNSVEFGMCEDMEKQSSVQESSLVLTENSIVCVVQGGQHIRIPYSSVIALRGIFSPKGEININIPTGVYRFHLARNGDDRPMMEAGKYLHSQIPV